MLLDVSQNASYTDYILIVSSKNARQSEAITDNVARVLKAGGRELIGYEGEHESQWRLLDYGDLVVHVFHHPLRSYYDLESLWSEADQISLNVPPEQRVASDIY